MFIILKISGMAWVSIAAAALILILIGAGVTKKFFPEKKNKPWKKI
ncbi:MAG: hypothetical protein WCW64_01580 [Phycisphaerae bacterium]|jgi:hypothetical protein